LQKEFAHILQQKYLKNLLKIHLLLTEAARQVRKTAREQKARPGFARKVLRGPWKEQFPER
jgi:hypothetical protein